MDAGATVNGDGRGEAYRRVDSILREFDAQIRVDVDAVVALGLRHGGRKCVGAVLQSISSM
jgi:hypothetical protein